MNILYIITGLTVGGAEVITLNLAKEMQQCGHKVAVMYLSGENKLCSTNEIEIVGLNMKKTPFGVLNALIKAKNYCNNFAPDVFHANMFHAILFSRFLKLIYPVKKNVDTVHTINIQGRLRMLLLKFTDFLSNVTTNVSQETVNHFINAKVFKKEKSIAVYNGIDLSKFYKNKSNSLRKKYGISDDDFVYINVSRIMPAKDHKNLLDAFKIVQAKNMNTKLICVGDGDLFDDIVEYSKKIGVDNAVIFTGNKKDISSYYNTADCFVLSSAWEGFGIVLAEAMACELPVISTDCGGTKEVVQNDDYLVPVRNPNVLAQKMIDVSLLTVEEREKIGMENRERTIKFDICNIVNQWISIYEK
ncbi:MAG: glycosyltransferase [Spirochaetaceae bacterium]|nr:glycosyltransferase [Spirochaetaceae bacterium]